ncbi:MAG: calcium-binding protein, partial [Pseudomonadota bacterium]
ESGRDFIWGGRGNDDIKGGAGLDFLNGGSGDDTLTGGEGLDFLRGGNGIDTFVFVEGADYDVVRDFREGDLIDVSDFGFTSFSEIEDNIFTFNGHTHIGFGTGDRLVLFGTNQNEIGAEDFIFQGDTIA